MAAEWFYQVMGQEFGPVEPGELRRLAETGIVKPDTPIRKGPARPWALAREVQGLFQQSGSPEKPDRVHPVTWAAIIVGSGFVLLLLWAMVFRGAGKESDAPAPRLENAQVVLSPASSRPETAGHSVGKTLDPVTLYANCRSAVATLLTKDDRGFDACQGSGFFIDQELVGPRDPHYVRDRGGKCHRGGYLLTNYHVIRSAATAKLQLDGHAAGLDAWIDGVVIEDEDLDLALVRVTVWPPTKPGDNPFEVDWAAVESKVPWYLKGIPTLGITKGADPAIGAKVYAIGSPQGLDASLSEGIVSGARDATEGVPRLQFTAPVSPGSSGGPLLDSTGQVVGVVTALRRGGQNLNFAVPASQVRKFLNGPCNPRELWRGSGINEEEKDAYNSVESAFLSAKRSGKSAPPGVESLCRANWRIKGKKYREAIEALAGVAPSSCAQFEYLLHYIIGLALDQRAHDALLKSKPTGEPGLSAQEECERFIRQHPHNQAAIVSLKRAIHLSPKFSPAYASLWVAYYRSGQDAEALLVADKLVQLVPRCSGAYTSRGSSFEDLGQPNSALQDYRMAVELSPNAPDNYCRMGEIYAKQRVYDKAIESYETAVKLGDESSFTLLFLGLALQNAGRLGEALAAFQKSREKTSDDYFRQMCDKAISECQAKMRR